MNDPSRPIAKMVAFLVLVLLTVLPQSLSAQNVVFKVQEISGESVYLNFAGWSDVFSYEFSVEGPTSLVTTPRFGTMKIVKVLDSASIPLMEAASSGRVFEMATIRELKNLGSGQQSVYHEIALKNVRILSYSIDGIGIDRVNYSSETIELKYGEISMTHYNLTSSTPSSATTQYTWKVEGNTKN